MQNRGGSLGSDLRSGDGESELNGQSTSTERKEPLKTEAICLRHSSFSETSEIATFFTRDYGKVSTIAKGARRKRSRLEGSIDILGHYEILFLPKKAPYLSTLTECTQICRFSGIAAEIDRFYTGLFIAESVKELTEEGDPCAALFEVLLEILRELEGAREPEKFALVFAVRALSLLGFFPEIRLCGLCSKPLPRRRGAIYSKSEGLILCRGCSGTKEKGSSLLLAPSALAFLQHFLSRPIATVKKVRLDVKSRREIAELVECIIEQVTGRRLKTLRFLSLGGMRDGYSRRV